MEHLTKHQIALLAVFLSFVTSIATSIVTVALLSRNALQTSPVVQTVNRVIEKVIPVATPVPQTSTPQTPTPSAEDLVMQAITRNVSSFVSGVASGSDGDLSFRGVMVGDRMILAPRAAADTNDVSARIATTTYALAHATSTTASPFALFTILPGSATSTQILATQFSPISLSTAAPKIGQAVIVLGSEDGGTADYGIISAITSRTVASSTVERIKTSVPFTKSDTGKLLVSPATGAVIGIVAVDDDQVVGIPASDISALLAPPPMRAKIPNN